MGSLVYIFVHQNSLQIKEIPVGSLFFRRLKEIFRISRVFLVTPCSTHFENGVRICRGRKRDAMFTSSEVMFYDNNCLNRK